MSATDIVLDVQGLTVDIATPRGTLHAVRDVSFQVARGETLCLVGESGCGKSMTSLAIMGLLPKAARRSTRRLAVLGEDLSGARPRRVNALRGNKMAMVFQEPMTALNPAYPIGDQLTEHYIHHRRASGQQARDRAVELLEKVGIASAAQRLGQYPHQLSGGLRQRVMIAMALMCGPELLIADPAPRWTSPSRRRSCGCWPTCRPNWASPWCSSPTTWAWWHALPGRWP